ncbi:hypothetical protein PF010_g23783 [Phytophthora fragariae]|uniref:Uncharacterized protein n=1 Tax=Phytophthora fragariae TaxID=53985 RepID=A0A6A3QHU8_9STRA|nr:hypothetical protein PF003_g38475 [Phytophthora fragariae]KAE8924353.1 hypothetical protein PF009_g25416 [Phytophthora fragariae]KAE8970359.1 hypothetical protein PF011_g26455 [Phytophthora fragariae]KAE9076439.1 hypothetical protein PF007_g24628 [Phytophthora fragariae]KAE9076743.1 hypothetical protein PF010_g23783 [Phytophthora fragariae]
MVGWLRAQIRTEVSGRFDNTGDIEVAELVPLQTEWYGKPDSQASSTITRQHGARMNRDAGQNDRAFAQL